MEIVQSLITQGGLGLMAGVFLWLYITERNDHKLTRKEKDELMEARRLDAKETAENVSAPLSSLSQTMNLVYDKLVASKRGEL